MSAFISKLRFEDSGAGFPLILTEPFIYESDKAGTITVPAGFPTDLASIPRPLWAILPPIGHYDRAAVVHDYLYKFPGSLSRGDVDSVFNEALALSKVSRLTRWTLYSAVRAGGWRPWRSYRSDEHAPR